MTKKQLHRKPVTVAVVDSGIDTTIGDLYKSVKLSTKFIIDRQGYIVEDNDKKILHPHGTVIASIISSICKNIEFISINILNERLVSDGRVLVHSLKKILLYSPDIIHLSLGTTSPRYIFQLKRIVRKAIKKNIIIVCSANNHGLKSYPAYLKGVVGVKASSNDINAGIKYENGFFYAPSMVIDELNLINISKRKQLKGTSISAAYITGYLALIKYEQGSIKNDDIIEKLKVLIKGGIYNASK